jgi:DNA replication protein DnaC
MSMTEHDVRIGVAVSVSELEITNRMSKLQRTIEDFRNRWETWSSPRVKWTTCDRHKTRRNLDMDASLRKSWAEREMLMVYKPCHKCVAEDVLRAKSGMLREAGVMDENVLHASFDNFECRSKDDEFNLKCAKEFSNKERGFLLMLGPVGTGKTHLAVAVMRALSCRMRFITQSRLLRKLRDTYRDERAEDPVKAFSSVKLLVLDEVGISAGGRDELPLIHDILSARHESRKPTVLTTNLDEAGFNQAVGERMADRLKQSGVAKLFFTGESMRPRFRKEYHENI